VAFAVAAAHELVSVSPDYYSVEFAFWAAKARDGGIDAARGTLISAGLRGALEEGSRSEVLWPYGVSPWPPGPAPAVAVAGARTGSAFSYAHVALSFDAIASALSSGPIILGYLIVPQSWKAPRGVVDVVAGRKPSGRHAVVALAHDDHKDALVVRNSWGERWGDRGYGYVTRAYTDLFLLSAFEVTRC